MYGLPGRLATRNGPQINCAKFQKFAVEYQFEHVKTSPWCAQSKGKSENSAKTAKNIFKKKLLMQAIIRTCLYWTSGIHDQKG